MKLPTNTPVKIVMLGAGGTGGHITRLFEAGLDIKEVQYLAGHSTVDMTLRVYTHYDRQSREKQTIEKVREAFRKESA